MAKRKCNRTPEGVYAEMWARMMRLRMQGPSGDAKEDKRMCECLGWPDLAKAFGRGKE